MNFKRVHVRVRVYVCMYGTVRVCVWHSTCMCVIVYDCMNFRVYVCSYEYVRTVYPSTLLHLTPPTTLTHHVQVQLSPSLPHSHTCRYHFIRRVQQRHTHQPWCLVRHRPAGEPVPGPQLDAQPRRAAVAAHLPRWDPAHHSRLLQQRLLRQLHQHHVRGSGQVLRLPA